MDQARITNLPLSQNICSETQFKIQHINHEIERKEEKKVLEPIYLKQLMATTKLAPVFNHLSEREK